MSGGLPLTKSVIATCYAAFSICCGDPTTLISAITRRIDHDFDGLRHHYIARPNRGFVRYNAEPLTALKAMPQQGQEPRKSWAAFSQSAIVSGS